MKAMLLVLSMVALTGTAGAQTNSFPSSGFVGIGTPSPAGHLHIKSVGASPWIVIEKNPSEETGLQFRKSGNVQFYFYTDNLDSDALKLQSTSLPGEDDALPRMQFPFDNKNIFMAQSGGNVGIGTNSPGGKLDINAGSAYAIRTSTTSPYVIEVKNTSAPGSGWWLVNDNNGSFALHENAVGNHFVLKRGGNLGLGTSDPGAKLEINKAGGQLKLTGGTVAAGLFTNSADMLHLADWNTALKGLSINLTSGNVGVGTVSPTMGKLQVAQSTDNSDNGVAILNSTGVRAMRLWTDPNNSYVYSGVTGQANLILNGTGNVGIGTSSPNQKLTVNGTIYGKEVKVNLAVPGPDYVFEAGYDLQSLQELEAYIRENKHLPEVPSAKEMAANGLNLSEMNLLLLKKLEEITLHLIQKDKEIKELRLRVEQLEK